MATELTVLLLSTLLLLAYIMLAIRFKTQQYGTDWNMGARDEDLPPLNAVAGRLERARDNFLETYPIAIVLLFGVVLAERNTDLTAAMAWLWLGARAVYLPLYWAGTPKVRTLVWAISMIALLVVLGVALLG